MNTVSPKLREWLDNFNTLMDTLLQSGFKPTPTNAREGLANLTKRFVTEIPPLPWIRDELIHAHPYDVPVRIYHPAPDHPLPVLIYFHGGGHMGGSITVYDPICRKLALAANHIVVSADYRLAPECPYPAGVTDALNSVKGVWTMLDGRDIPCKRRLSIAGDSAGGSLCAAVSHTAQFDASIDIRQQTLIYPSVDYTMNSPSMDEYARGYLLQKEKILWYFDNYFQNSENRKAVSPLHMEFTDHLPETLVITAGFCPLRDEGAAYAQKVKATGRHGECLNMSDMIHAFLNLEDLVKEECETVYKKIGEFLNRP